MWVMTSARAAGVMAMLLVLVAMPPKGPWRGFWLTGIAAGLLDTVGNLFYLRPPGLDDSTWPRWSVRSTRRTILLAALVLREWPTRRQIAGMALALAAVLLLSV